MGGNLNGASATHNSVRTITMTVIIKYPFWKYTLKNPDAPVPA